MINFEYIIIKYVLSYLCSRNFLNLKEITKAILQVPTRHRFMVGLVLAPFSLNYPTEIDTCRLHPSDSDVHKSRGLSRSLPTFLSVTGSGFTGWIDAKSPTSTCNRFISDGINILEYLLRMQRLFL